jgi:transcriptional regulator with XRE-family HTH domain
MAGAADDGYGDFYKEVGQRIRAARMNAKITQADLADLIGLTRTSVTNLEAGRQRMPLHLFAAIERAVSAPAGSLLPPLEDDSKAQLDRTVGRHLLSAPDTTRDFVQGAIAGLSMNREEGQGD